MVETSQFLLLPPSLDEARVNWRTSMRRFRALTRCFGTRERRHFVKDNPKTSIRTKLPKRQLKEGEFYIPDIFSDENDITKPENSIGTVVWFDLIAQLALPWMRSSSAISYSVNTCRVTDSGPFVLVSPSNFSLRSSMVSGWPLQFSREPGMTFSSAFLLY